jgi:hypothetical protein
MQNNPFDDENPLTPTIAPPVDGNNQGGWYPYPNAPAQPKRTVMRWIILGVHIALFLAVWGISQNNLTNDLRLIVMGWGLFLIAHTLITCLLDMREGYVHGRRIRRAKHQAEIIEKRARMLEKLHNKPE